MTLARENDTASIELGPLRITTHGLQTALSRLDSLVREGQSHGVNFCDSHLFVQACRNPELARALNRSRYVFADGILLVLVARLLGLPRVTRVPGPSFMLAACEYGVAKGYRHFFCGGEPGVADELARRLQRQFPGMIIAGTYCPPFRALTAEDHEQMHEMIRQARPDFVWVGLGALKQVAWIDRHLTSPGLPLMLGVGAAFDFHSGRVPWAPRWIRVIGMEWIYRSFTGGRRVFWRNLRCVPLSAFVALGLVLKAWSGALTQRSQRA